MKSTSPYSIARFSHRIFECRTAVISKYDMSRNNRTFIVLNMFSVQVVFFGLNRYFVLVPFNDLNLSPHRELVIAQTARQHNANRI